MSQLGDIAKANEHVILTGQADGSVKLFAGRAQMVLTLPETYQQKHLKTNAWKMKSSFFGAKGLYFQRLLLLVTGLVNPDNRFSSDTSIPDAQCMAYLPTFTINLGQM